MPKSPGVSDAVAGLVHRKRTFLLAVAALGAFFVGRSTQLKWSPSEYLKDIALNEDITGTASAAAGQPHLLQDAPYYLNDRTMRLSPYVDHLWLHNGDLLPESDSGKPNVKLILTEMGWNQPNVTAGFLFPRSIRLREIMQAVIDHPLFDPTFSWTDMVAGKIQVDPDIQYFVFLDVETCFESNYPHYVSSFPVNADVAGHRTIIDPLLCPCFDINGCPPIQQALDTPLFRKLPTARLMFFDCRGNGPTETFRTTFQLSPQLSLVSLSSEPKQLLAASDMGLPPPPLNTLRLSHKERHQILHTCEQESSTHRKYFLSCLGAVRNTVRRRLFTLHNESAGVLLLVPDEFRTRFGATATYHGVMRESVFAATPRGDNRFSYRFTEVLSGGAIPVLHADGWVLPFRRELVDWEAECAIVIPEARVLDTLRILRNISLEERCRRRRRCYQIYTNYMANAEGTVRGIIESATGAIQTLEASKR